MARDTLPALFWGLAIGIGGLPTISIRRILAIVGFVAAFLTTLFIVMRGRNIFLENIAGIGALLAAFWPGHSPLFRLPAALGKDAYGVYLVHVLFIEAMFAIVARGHIPNSIPLKLAEFAIALILSYATVWLLNRSKWTSWVNG
jgi:peptidoglycan/LPS O-acetylase OafA/YrhL